MRLFVDRLEFEIDGPYYIDVILSAEELDRIRSGEMVNTAQTVGNRRFYVGAILQRKTRHEKESINEEESTHEG